MKHSRLLPLLMALVMVTAVFAGCKSREEGADSSSSSSKSSSSSSSSSTPGAKGTVGSNTPDFREIVKEMKQENEDTVGYMYVANTDIEDVVVCHTGTEEKNKYYQRLNFNKEPEFNGVYWADYRSVFGDGSRKEIGINTCIYGHAMTDDPEKSSYTIKFGPLHDLRDPGQATDMPYVYFSTETEALAYEIFAVFIVNSDQNDIPYNREPKEGEDFVKMVKEKILPRSIYDYDVELKDDDKFLTLSTCIYNMPDGTSTNYPNTNYRYGIMARLVDPSEPFKEKASFTINEDMVVDPDGAIDYKG